MRSALVFCLLAACGGPSQRQLAETPAATERGRPAEAPPANIGDKDRERSIQQFDDMERTQQAYDQAGQAGPEGSGSGSATPVKKGPAEQAPLQPKSTPVQPK